MISSKNKKAEILEAYFELLDEHQMLQNEVINLHKVVHPVPAKTYIKDFKVRSEIHNRELHLLLEDVSKFFRFIRENSASIVTHAKVSLPQFSK
tara:strand:+ start:9979 stop:10260 length:282 start_codon:yes stop_codon:yes gene_type:complete